MAEAAGRPFLGYLVEQLRDQGFRDLVLCVGHLASHILDTFGDGGRWGVRIRYAVETQLLGTAGAIRNAQPLLSQAFLALNGDSYLDADFRHLLAAHRRGRAADPGLLATLAAVQVQDASPFGTLELDGQGRIVSFREKTTACAGWINAGVYVLEPALLDLIPVARPVSIERETFPLALQAGHHLHAWPAHGFFVDIGTPQGYRLFQTYIHDKQYKPTKVPPPQGGETHR
jgi:NDP-sugar pyrophosphorylase family protein